ncbi:MAG: YeeE/YedE family protein [Myxococcota bacterium]
MTLSPAFTPQVAAIAALGGALIGLSAALLLCGQGRILGVSGIVGRLFSASSKDTDWRVVFLIGVGVGAIVLGLVSPDRVAVVGWAPLGQLAVAGLLVGYGTQLGNGCTSGHGVCGLARRSPRSLAATLTFMGTAAAVVFTLNQLKGA